MAGFEEICSELTAAFAQQTDPISLMTLVELHNEEVNNIESFDNKTKYVKLLAGLLAKYPDIVRQIGWDLPRSLLLFLSSTNIFIYKALYKSPVIHEVMACFIEIAKSGDPEHCLLSACDLLSRETGDTYEIELHASHVENNFINHTNDISGGLESELKKNTAYVKQSGMPDNLPDIENMLDSKKGTEPRDDYLPRTPNDFFVILRSYILFELIENCLKRIKTLYPSKYLGPTVIAIEKFVNNNTETINDITYLLRKTYLFCRDYTPPSLPNITTLKETFKDFDDLKFKTIIKDEKLLQIKLLRNLLTFGAATPVRFLKDRTECRYYCHLVKKDFVPSPFYFNMLELYSRFYQLSLSFDIDLLKEFKTVLKESRSIYSNIPQDSNTLDTKDKELYTKSVYKLAYDYQFQQSTKKIKVSVDPYGIVLLSGTEYFEMNEHLYPEISISDAIYLYMRFATVSLYSRAFQNTPVEDVSRYWIWVAITHRPTLQIKKELNQISNFVILAFFQVLILKNCAQNSAELRMISFTLITRLLCLVEEDIAFQFILNVLNLCPYKHGKSSALCILSDLMTRRRAIQINKDAPPTKDIPSKKDTNSIDDILSELTIEPNEPKTINNTADNNGKCYIQMEKQRMQIIHDITFEYINDSFAKDQKDKDSSTDTDSMLLLTYLKFLVGVKDKWSVELLTVVNDEVKLQLESVPSNMESEFTHIKNTVDTLDDFLKTK